MSGKVKNLYFDVLEETEKAEYLNDLNYDIRLMVAEKKCNQQIDLYRHVMDEIAKSFKKNEAKYGFVLKKERENYFNCFKNIFGFEEKEKQNVLELYNFCFEKYLKENKNNCKGE
ncbi:hypothetical protein [Thomasclavelia sp.]|uniref:hypothetical protein n=1 Tax=Thomasclavelia sp. TaxID=3025757 RepID=UPI0025E26184|nr:hypothetical protein [Thomasclavelia sp.]